MMAPDPPPTDCTTLPVHTHTYANLFTLEPVDFFIHTSTSKAHKLANGYLVL